MLTVMLSVVLRLKGMPGDVALAAESMQLSATRDQKSHTVPPGMSVQSGNKPVPTSQKRPSERSSKDIPHK